MTNETCPFDSADDKAEWEETHFGIEDEDAAYESERQKEIDDKRCEHTKAFDKWLSKYFGVNFAERGLPPDVVDLARAAFFAGASYGIDQTAKLYRGEEDD